MDFLLLDIGRIGIGIIFLIAVGLDFKTRPQLFELMAQKKVPLPWLFFLGAVAWKALTGIGLVFNIYPLQSALLLSLYVFIANLIFNNFWSTPKEQWDFSFAQFLIHLVICFGLLAIAAGYW